MSTVTNIDRKFSGPVDGVVLAGVKIQSAMKSDEYGPAVLARMAPTQQDDFDTLVTALVKAVSDQSTAKGNVHTLTEDQQKALTEIKLSLATARDVAKSTFPTNKPMLHDEFTVNQNTPHTIGAIIGRGRKVHTACVTHAEPMAANGWQVSDTTELAGLITTLESANVGRSDAGGTQKGSTAGVVNLANAMHTWIRRVQIAANRAYPAEKATSDNNIVKSRSKYLLGVYPASQSSPVSAPADPPAPAAGGNATAASTSPAS